MEGAARRGRDLGWRTEVRGLRAAGSGEPLEVSDGGCWSAWPSPWLSKVTLLMVAGRGCRDTGRKRDQEKHSCDGKEGRAAFQRKDPRLHFKKVVVKKRKN